ncbi:hypothetical protein [uncultured Amaricoccus sp.]|uniref:hypothetical protein n=1 Tax=uncultured Amaricoccus sp. TaxID=339341 RepID=UPI002620B0AD|nr:hypothetical protein [uncultured Amaricoccus sp.]
MPPGRRRWLDAAFVVVWMILWTAAILIAVWMLGAAALEGELGAAVTLVVWVGAAGFGLYSAGRGLVQTLVTGKPRRPNRRRWDDGMPPPSEPPER